MKSIDIKSVIIGLLIAVVIILLVQNLKENNNLGDIEVRSISVVNDLGKKIILIEQNQQYGGRISINDEVGKTMVSLTNLDNGGAIATMNKNQQIVTRIGTSAKGEGMISVGKEYGDYRIKLMVNDYGDGQIVLINNYNKINCLISSSEQGGSISLQYPDESRSNYIGQGGMGCTNMIGIETCYLGTSQNDDGLIKLFDKVGTLNWFAIGEK